MINKYVSAVFFGSVLLAAAAAQERAPNRSDQANDRANPVPVRLTASVYRAADVIPDSQPGPLMLSCNLLGEYTTTLAVQNGTPGALVSIAVAAQPAAVLLPGMGTVLVSADAVAVQGVFNAAGVFEYPIELARPQLAGHAVFAQAFQMAHDYWPMMCVSEGLQLAFAAGNQQPALGYAGPPMTAIPCKAVDPTLDQDFYSVLLEWNASEYVDAKVVDVQGVSDQTMAVMVQLVRSDVPRSRTMPLLPLREVVDLGPFPHPLVEIWVAATGSGSCICYEKAALIDLRY
jgi:hypothetical protein